MKEINPHSLVLFDVHFTGENIASQRFKIMSKYFSPNLSVLAISDKNSEYVGTGTSVKLIECSRLVYSKYETLALATYTVFPKTSFKYKMFSNSWIFKAVSAADNYIKSRKLENSRILVMGTYSPVSSLVASRVTGYVNNVPFAQDFRDGLYFENRGAGGYIRSIARKMLEYISVSRASLITTVSRPIEKYFRETYSQRHICIISNGFDPSQFVPKDNSVSVFDIDKNRIGHFGRIGGSEAKRTESLRDFIELIRAVKNNEYHLIFMGEISIVERNIISNIGTRIEYYENQKRSIAINSMSNCQCLLLLTGDAEGTATGKLFEYLASGARIALFSQAENEACRILREIGDGDFIFVKDRGNIADAAVAFDAFMKRDFSRSFEKIEKYSRKHQAEVLEAKIIEVCEKFYGK